MLSTISEMDPVLIAAAVILLRGLLTAHLAGVPHSRLVLSVVSFVIGHSCSFQAVSR